MQSWGPEASAVVSKGRHAAWGPERGGKSCLIPADRAGMWPTRAPPLSQPSCNVVAALFPVPLWKYSILGTLTSLCCLQPPEGVKHSALWSLGEWTQQCSQFDKHRLRPTRRRCFASCALAQASDTWAWGGEYPIQQPQLLVLQPWVGLGEFEMCRRRMGKGERELMAPGEAQTQTSGWLH